MAVLPQTGISLDMPIEVEQQPGRTWKINTESKRIEGEIDDFEAVRQAVEIILHVERFRWQIYSPYSGMQWEGLIGQNPGYVNAELQRRIRDALTMDDRVTGISNYRSQLDGNTLTVFLTVNTVYGDTTTTMEVPLG